jgi:eukaryotic-like serine/threonine-protein kinase
VVDGGVTILDFGIAKAASAADVRDDQETVTHAVGTEPGLLVGTVPYMSPEQVRGESVDARSDIFALGAVLFEMLTGKVAFAEPSAAETMSAVFTRDPLSDVRNSDAWSLPGSWLCGRPA